MRALVYGMGVTGEAVADALERRGVAVLRADDDPARGGAGSLDDVGMLVPSPGVP